jgi:phosphatidylserine/phosphatidylglycerophosphate/cardiolipin synthase-like enzyme
VDRPADPIEGKAVEIEDWFLSARERGNDATRVDRRHANGAAWTDNNRVTVLVDGADYFRRLHDTLCELERGDHIWFTDWQGHADEQLAGLGTELGPTLAKLAERGVLVRGLLWRSHPRQAHFAEQDNMHLAREINQHGGLLALDERVRRGGSHHQKLVVIHRTTPTDDDPGAAGRDRSDVAFVGGIDLCHGRHDDQAHSGDPQTIKLDERYGTQPSWHDLQMEVRGPAVDDLSWSFRERWEDPAPLDHRNPLRALLRRVMRQPRTLPPLPDVPRPPDGQGDHAVQVLRTYPSRRPPYGFAPRGERSVARAYLKAIDRARRLVAIEDQYLWSREAANALADALRTHSELLVVIVVPRYPDRDGRLTGAANRYARNAAIQTLVDAGGPRVAVYDLENRRGEPIYVHAKVCIIDDVWLEIGSDNLNRRSWTHDSEIGCAVIDEQRDPRPPQDPAGLGDGARLLARNTRLTLWREHLGRPPGDDDDLIDPQSAFDTLCESARQLDDWSKSDERGNRPPGHLRPHVVRPVSTWLRPFSALLYRTVLDPDGRPRQQRTTDTY